MFVIGTLPHAYLSSAAYAVLTVKKLECKSLGLFLESWFRETKISQKASTSITIIWYCFPAEVELIFSGYAFGNQVT